MVRGEVVDKEPEDFLYKDITDKIIGCAYTVYNYAGTGFNEPIYQEMLHMELRENGMKSVREYYLPIYYKGKKLARSQRADIVVEDKVILEIKAVTKLKTEHEMQLVRYLKLSGIKVGLIVNFGHARTLEVSRKIYTDTRYLTKGNIPE